MPRVIKFRAWLYEKMVYNHSVNLTLDGEVIYLDTVGEWVKDENNEVKLMQYTGLKDKNSKEIYEGDIVKCTELRNDKIKEYVSEVFWYQACFWLNESKTCDTPLDLFFPGIEKIPLTEIEVIGNIYENQELLEG